MTLDKDHPIESADLDAHMATAVNSIRILTVNTHKGFTALNRRFILPELREAVRSVSADVVFLQEVLGTHEKHAMRFHNWPKTPQYEFLADSIWTDFAYGRNAVYPDGDHGNALLSKFPIIRYENLDISIAGPERRGLLHSVLQVPGHEEFHAICVHLGLRESHRAQQLELLCNLLDGMVAVEGGLGGPTGPLWNELPDRIADSVFIVALGMAAIPRTAEAMRRLMPRWKSTE